MDEKEVLPLDASADGKRNAYVVMCTATAAGDFRRNYAVCQHLIRGLKAGTINEELYGDCANLLRKNSNMCAAHRMREHEQKVGHAVYFVDRKKDAIESERAVPHVLPVGGWGEAKTKRVESKPSSKSSVIDRIDTGGYADALNAARSETKMKPSEPHKVSAPDKDAKTDNVSMLGMTHTSGFKIEAKPGESLIEMARRLAAQNKERTNV